MATLTRAEVAARALEAMGVIGAGQTASALDSARAGEALDSVYYRLRKEGLAPFALATTPEWAQSALIYATAADLAAAYGLSTERAQILMAAAAGGRRDLAAQVQAKKHAVPIKARFF